MFLVNLEVEEGWHQGLSPGHLWGAVKECKILDERSADHREDFSVVQRSVTLACTEHNASTPQRQEKEASVVGLALGLQKSFKYFLTLFSLSLRLSLTGYVSGQAWMSYEWNAVSRSATGFLSGELSSNAKFEEKALHRTGRISQP